MRYAMNDDSLIKVVIADEMVIYRQSLETILSERDKFLVLNSCGHIDELKHLITDEDDLPDVALISLFMAERDSLKRAKRLRDAYPTIKIILLVALDNGKFSMKYLRRSFVDAILIRSLYAPEDVLALVRVINLGYSCFPSNDFVSKYLPDIK